MKKIIYLFLLINYINTAAQNKTVVKESIYDIKIEGIDGKNIDLKKYKGKKILFVNVASECGFTKQYDGLQELYTTYNTFLKLKKPVYNQKLEKEKNVFKYLVIIIEFKKINLEKLNYYMNVKNFALMKNLETKLNSFYD